MLAGLHLPGGPRRKSLPRLFQLLEVAHRRGQRSHRGATPPMSPSRPPAGGHREAGGHESTAWGCAAGSAARPMPWGFQSAGHRALLSLPKCLVTSVWVAWGGVKRFAGDANVHPCVQVSSQMDSSVQHSILKERI